MSVVVHMRIVTKGDVSVTQDIPEIQQINVQVRCDSESYNVTLFAFANISRIAVVDDENRSDTECRL